MGGGLREIAAPFVVAAPAGARVRARLVADPTDDQVLWTIGRHLGSFAGADLAARCTEGALNAEQKKVSRRERKRSLTAVSSSRWAGAITRTSNDAWGLRKRNLEAERTSLRARVEKISCRLVAPVGGKKGRTRGYASQAERFSKQQRLQVLKARLSEVEARLADGRMSITRGGKALARERHNLEAAGITAAEWRNRWEAERLFICADGEADKGLGNETIRWDPADGALEIKLPVPLARLANRPGGRYRLSAPVTFAHRGDEVAAQAATGAVRYDISFDPDKRRWYLDASWKSDAGAGTALDDLRAGPVLAVDVNKDHLAGWVVSPDGNPVGAPITVTLDLAGLPSGTRDGRLRAAISELVRTAKAHGCGAFVIEDLGFTGARDLGREHSGRRPSRGGRGRAFRAMVPGIPDGPQHRGRGHRRRPRLHQQMGRPALAGAPQHPVLNRGVRPPRCGLHDRQTRAWTASQAPGKVWLGPTGGSGRESYQPSRERHRQAAHTNSHQASWSVQVGEQGNRRPEDPRANPSGT